MKKIFLLFILCFSGYMFSQTLRVEVVDENERIRMNAENQAIIDEYREKNAAEFRRIKQENYNYTNDGLNMLYEKCIEKKLPEICKRVKAAKEENLKILNSRNYKVYEKKSAKMIQGIQEIMIELK